MVEKEEVKTEPMEVDEDGNPVEGQPQEEEESVIFHLKILPLTHELHQKHGLRHNDYQRYRGYCARRLARVRKALKFVQGERKKFTKKEVTAETVKDNKFLEIPLITAERAWSYAMQLKFEMNTEPRKKYHMLNRLRKAEQEAAKLEALVMALEERVDARAKLEVQAYRAWIAGNLAFERQEWPKAAEELTKARMIYEKLAATLNEDEAELYKQRMNEIVPSLRFCAYNSGDEVAKKDLMKMRNMAGEGGVNVDDLINQAREEQASTLQDIEWRGRKMAVKQEKIRVFLLRDQEFSEELKNAEDDNAKVESYESLLMDCKDAIQVLRDELLQDPNFRNREQTNEGAVSAAHFLYTYLRFLKSSRTIERNLVMIEEMRRRLELGETANNKSQQKPVKAQDLVRLYETIIQNLSDMPSFAGLEEDLAFKQDIESKVVYYRAWRCNFIAQAFLAAQKWQEAMALFQRATVYAKKAMAETNLDEALKKSIDHLIASIEGKQFMAHANSILESESGGAGGDRSNSKANRTELASTPLIDRLDVYYEDPDLLKGKANLAAFPPKFEAIPCKPLFFDLAHEQLEFPDLSNRLGSRASGGAGGAEGGQGSGGWLGGWLGGWGGKK